MSSKLHRSIAAMSVGAAALGVLGVWLCLQHPAYGQAAGPEQPELEVTDTVTRHRTWKFSEKVRVGRVVRRRLHCL